MKYLGFIEVVDRGFGNGNGIAENKRIKIFNFRHLLYLQLSAKKRMCARTSGLPA